ncbi:MULTISPECIES: peptidase T [Bacillus]|uniref:peptidase T n=1 Tax=Bacillus TaxID=1386 RepID=UPI0007FB46A4|nr:MULTISPECIES: peptidase T [Bacillus]MCY1092962.1 peptidase T [Bacillus safensis]MCY7469117.1 peptidase T [Bacillus safensis]MDH6564287.1 tripeptide aminopeptidase [Bacillus sp. TBS-096]NWF41466.1 peptidase T [Bacillus sp. 8A6]OBW51304.1 peptidase T [Bacillus safensis]
MKEEMIQRFTSYVKVDTQSDAEKESCPSTEGQLNLARQLVEEMKSIGIQEVTMDENGYVMGTIPSNTDKDVPTIGFLAHIDTATDFTGKNVKPQLHENYQGGDITLNEDLHIVLSPQQFPNLQKYQGHTLITTDGTTLLGADNKAGIAEIMTAMHYLIEHPDIKHGKIRVAFTPDEEIGRGPHKFDVDAFGASYAYTIDGGPLGELQYESFNAAGAKVSIKGNNVHPGTAKDKMVSAAKIGMLFHNKLPSEESPEYTEGYEGFFHLTKFVGEVEEAELQYIIRDFDKEKFNNRKALFEKIANDLKATYGENSITLSIQDQYYNMREKIEPVKHIVDIAHEAMENRSVTPVIEPIRGGTDGSQLSYKGLPTPNIFTGGENFHGKYEFISVENMVKATEVIVEIARLFEEKA